MATKPGPDMQEPHHEDVLDFVRENRKPFVTTTEVSERFRSVSRRTIQQRLNDLVDKGDLKGRDIGGNSKVWYLPAYES